MNAAGGGGRVSRSDENDAAVLRWLLEGDPSISWQVLADLVGASQDEIDPERAQVGVQGWGARLLAAQSDDGRWADALYSPKWTSTTYTLLLLHWLGLPRGHPQAIAGCRQVWDGPGSSMAASLSQRASESLRRASREFSFCWRLHSAAVTTDWIPRSMAV